MKMNSLKLFFVLLLFLHQYQTPLGDSKLYYQRDFSEHCRRRVVPSVFLGRHVVDANARVMQFRELELPYSCFITVRTGESRTESGSNMVMVLLVKPKELKTACSENNEQLLVYEMGETYGGYWASLPELETNAESAPTETYTLKTTLPTISPEISVQEAIISEDLITATEESTSLQTSDKKETGDYIVVEVPLLNISVKEEPGVYNNSQVGDLEAAFEFNIDVTPIKGIAYDTSMIPLVQFRMQSSNPHELLKGDDEPPKYELDIIEEFTPDLRLRWPQVNPTVKRRKWKQKYHTTRRINFKKHRTLINPKYNNRLIKSQIITSRINDVTQYNFPTVKKTSTMDVSKTTLDSWHAIKQLMEKLNKTKNADDIHTKQLSYDSKMLGPLANMDHSKSIYISNVSLFGNNPNALFLISTDDSTRKPLTLPTKLSAQKLTKMNITPKGRKSINIFSAPTKNTDSNEEFSKETRDTFSVNFNSTNATVIAANVGNTTESVTGNPSNMIVYKTEMNKEPQHRDLTDSRRSQKLVTGSMVGHESWENVVQAAPVMAVLLNQTMPNLVRNSSDGTGNENKTLQANEQLKRKKRVIQSIPIEDAQPHKMSTRAAEATTTQRTYDIADLQEFAQLVELQDDEVQGRVALRNLRQYVGPVIYDLCLNNDGTERHIHLFNSSRIVLSFTNYTIERMVIVMTAARTLLTGEMRCPASQLECQVSGNRVCLDSMAACDGVPNCGSYDIYDEDRVMCGQSVGLQHNVFLAAFTFLAVLLTLLYTVHYWLKRCVPKVADAFFIYTDGVENMIRGISLVLYLDTIMRPPNDDVSKNVYHANAYERNLYNMETDIVIPENNKYQQFWRKICCCFSKKKPQPLERKSSEPNLNTLMPKKMFSFTELEISKMQTAYNETAVQTGDSLEMNYLNHYKCKDEAILKDKEAHRLDSICYNYPMMIHDSSLTLDEPLPEGYKDELGLLKFFNDARKNSIEETSSKLLLFENPFDDKHDDNEEKELRNHAYDQPQPGPSRTGNNSKLTVKDSVQKHLRFDEVATTIPFPEAIDESSSTRRSMRRSVVLGEGLRGLRLDSIKETDENASGKEHRHFWGTTKAKRTKKTAHVFPK